MPKSCPSCGAATIPGARFCRQCGTSLGSASHQNNSPAKSPLAATVPLSDEGLTTDDLAAESTQRTLPGTSEVGHPTADDLLQHLRSEKVSDPKTTAQAGQQTLRDEQSSITMPPASEEMGPPGIPPVDFAEAALSDDEEEITITVPRPALSSTSAIGIKSVPMQKPVTKPTHALPMGREEKAGARWLWLEIVVAGVIVLCIIVTVAWLAMRSFRNPASSAQSSATPVPVSDPKGRAQAKLSEAEALLASGNREGAIARLREATRLDPSNMETHRRLGDLLFRQGARREAIDEYRAIIQINSNDTMAWRALASAQLAEGLYNEAAESYQRLMAVPVEKASGDDSVQLSYANALRLAGRVEEARAVYQRASESSNVDVARTAQQRLAELPLETKAPSPEPSRDTHATADQTRTMSETVVSSGPAPIPSTKPTPAVTPALSANEHFNRGVTLWRSNRTAAVAEFHAAANGGNPDAYYYLGLSIAEGHDPRILTRAELVAALSFFQKARYGKFSAQARQYEDHLGKEYDLRRQKP